MRYVIFETEFGFFGILGEKNGILRTSLPTVDAESSREHLLEGIGDAEFDKKLMAGVQKKIISYFSGTYVEFGNDIPLLIDDWPDFTGKVLRACMSIPYGTAVSYSKLGELAGRKKAGRAVGNVMANNPIPLIIPCHRVRKSDGTIGGFQKNRPGGVNLKKRMLRLEKNSAKVDKDGFLLPTL